MSENKENDYIFLLKEIFFESKKNTSEIYPIIKNSENISKFKIYIENDQIDNLNKLSLLKEIKNYFLSNINLIPFFISKYNSNSSNFYFPLINLYISKDTNEEDLKFLENFLLLLNNHISIPKLPLEFIYQKLSEYYRNKSNNILTESLLIRYLHLLQIFYKDTNTPNPSMQNNEQENQETPIPHGGEQENQEEEKEIKNYIYLNGYGSGMTLSLNYNSSNYQACFPSLENGCTFLFWINLNENLLKIYRKIFPTIEISLITIKVGEKEIKLILKETRYLQIIIDGQRSNNQDISSTFQFNKWNNIGLVILGKSDNYDIKIYINSGGINPNCSLPKTFPINEKIESIRCFDNLIGSISSLLFFSFPLDTRIFTYFNIKLKYGFYKNKILYLFLHSNNNKYLSNAINFKYIEKYKNEKNNLNKEFKILSKEWNGKNIISFFCPFAFNKNKKEIDDIFGNYVGILSKDDGVNFYRNYIKNIKQAGGMSVLLPIAELMFSSIAKNQNISYPYIDKNILSEKTLFEFLIIIKNLLINHSKNLYDANKSKFFSSLGLFLEKFPSKIFTEHILDVLIEIGKEIFQTEFDYNSSKYDNYINMILLNERIFSKFSQENQRKLWDKVYQFFYSDYSQMKDSLNISKICLLLRFYDEKRYNEYCCSEHAKIFSKSKNEKEDKIKVMSPEMGKKVDKLFDTIQIYINRLPTDKEDINLYKLLTLDISPCLQNKIIDAYINHFSSENIKREKKISTLNNLMENNYLEITEYVLSISLLDVRLKILSLFKIIISDYYDIVLKYFGSYDKISNTIRIENSLSFIGENLLPDKLLVEIDCIKSKDDKDKDFIQNYNIDDYEDYFDKCQRSYTEKNINIKRKDFKVLSNESLILTNSKKLVKYLNPNIYNEQISNLYKFLIEWIAFKIVKEKKIINFVIDFLINLVCKISPYYIDNFSNYLYSCFHITDLVNNYSLFQNKNLYPWIIETIFYFNNSDNNNKGDKEIILKINEQVLNLFTEIFKGPQNQLKMKIKYILDYSYYIKYLNIDKNKKKEEISKITRILLEKIIGCSHGNINVITETCFEFMIFYKNSENLFKIDYEINDMENRSNTCFFASTTKPELIDDEKKINKEDNKNIIGVNLEESNDQNNLEENNVLLKTKTEINDSIFSQKKDLLPKYILDGLFYFKPTENINNNSELKTLNEIWKDFFIYDGIIDYYSANVWGIENICKKVNIEYEGKWKDVCKLLLEQYGNTNYKKNKNILLNEILKLLNLSQEQEKENLEENLISNKDKDNRQKNLVNNINLKKDMLKYNNDDIINILNINLILLCIAIEITKDSEQKEYIEKQYQQFLIFCILASINISPSVKKNEQIQDLLYVLLGFGFMFLKKKDKRKYDEIIICLIEPIIKEMNDDYNKGGLKSIIGMQKKALYKSSAVYKLFANISFDDTIKENDNKKDKEKEDSKAEKSLKRTTRLETSGVISELNRNNKNKSMSEEIKDKEINDDTSVGSKKIEHRNRIILEFHVNESEVINKLFNRTFEIFKNNRENNDTRETIKNYYEVNKTEKDIDLGVESEKNKIKKKIKELIPLVETQIRQYSNTSFLQEKKRKNKYKKLKKRLFSWRGFWSDRYLFIKHPEYLKVKIKNHFTKEMVKPLFSPVLDINYYLPEFSKFDKENLFNKNNYNYNINLDIDEILGDEINNILNKKEEENIEGKNNNLESMNSKYNKNNNLHSERNIRNNYGFNYLECLYKLNYEDIWKMYNNYNDLRFSVEKKEVKKNNKENLFKSQISSDSKNKNQINLPTLEGQIYSSKYLTLNCCIVKPTHHIKGNISITKEYIQFLYEYNDNKSFEMIQDELENDPNFDKDMGCCFGSTFKSQKKDKDNIGFALEYSKINYMFIRVYFYRESALEIYTDANKSIFFNFKTKEDMHLFLNELLEKSNFREIKTENKRIIGYEQLFNITAKKKSYYINNKMELWQKYEISTLEYLMWLNIYSGRSFNDLTQYPIIPWIISNYQSEEINNKSDKRDLSLPMGMLEINRYEKSFTRKETYVETYESLKNEFEEANPDFLYDSYLKDGDEYYDSYKAKKIKLKKKEEKKNNDNNINIDIADDFVGIQINQIPYYFGSHYSNPTYVCHYLTRIFPFSFISIEIQGDKFDDPDRMFISIEKTFESACTLKDDVRELIPEFYTLPGIFKNINNLNLTQGKMDSEGNIIDINDINLPPWSEDNPANFVTKMRKFLEIYGNKINKWIDLIFGSCQRGEKAEELHNIYMAQTYEKMIKIEEIYDPDYRNTLMRLNEIGVTPYKILFNDCKPRLPKDTIIQKTNLYSKGNFLYDSNELYCINFVSEIYHKILTNNKKNKKKASVSNGKIESIIYPKILCIKCIDHENLKIFLNSNQWYNIKVSIGEKMVNHNDLELHNFENNSSLFASSYQISSTNNTFIVYGNGKYVLKGGFWDGRLEFNSLPSEPKEYPKSSCIFSEYSSPIVTMEISKDEEYLICGTNNGIIQIFKLKDENIENIDNIFLHSDEITSISINQNLNMFATVAKDGYLLLYVLPSFSLVRAIKISPKINIKRKKHEHKDKVKEETKEEIYEQNNEEIKDKAENKEETKEETKAEIYEQNNEEIKYKAENKEETKEETKEEINNKQKDNNKDKKENINEVEEVKDKEIENKIENKIEDKKEEIKNNINDNQKEKENDENKNNEELKNEIKEDNKEIKDDIKEENIEKPIINKEENITKEDEKNKDKENEDNLIDKNNNKETPNSKEKNDMNTEEEIEESEDDEKLFADNVFLSSSPLPCVTIYISEKRIFRTYTINGEFVGEEKEEDDQGSQFIKSPKIIQDLYFQEYLIYGTDKGYVKIRAFPKMNIIRKIMVGNPGNSIETLEISKDKRFCYVWSKGNKINIIKDINTSFISSSENIARMGFNIGY